MLNNGIKKYTYFIGIDVSRNELDLAVMQGGVLMFHKEVENKPLPILDFIRKLKTLPKFMISKAVFCMEHSGFYGNHLVSCLRKCKANIVLENSLHIINSSGQIRGKNDKVDAIRIAEYAYRSRERLRVFVPRRKIIDQLAELNTLRSRLLSLHQTVSSPLKEQKSFVRKGVARNNTRLCTLSAKALKSDLETVEERITSLIDSDEHLKRLMEIMTSVKTVGPVTGVSILLATNEFRNISNPKKFACYAGVAPFTRESGTTKSRARVSHIADKKMKAILHLCAIRARRTIPELKRYFERKTVIEGKSKMLVLNNIRYKMILRIFACVNQDRCYESEYHRPSY
jgi:transposase